MTEGKPVYRLVKNNILFFSAPLCAVPGMIKFQDIYKTMGLILFICVFCAIYELYKKIAVGKENVIRAGFKSEILTVLAFIVTVSFGIFADIPVLRWLFLTGVLLAAIFSGVMSALMSIFAYVLVITVFTEVTPEFVANSFLLAVITVILTQYFSDFMSVIYSVITVLSFETAFLIIMHGLKPERFITTSFIADTFIISDCIIAGWILYSITSRKLQSNENTGNLRDFSKNENITDSNGIINDKENNAKSIKEKDYSYLLTDNIEIYKKILKNVKLLREAERTSNLVKEITKLVKGNVSLAEVGAFYAECGRIVSSNYIKEGLILAKDNNFPNEVTAFIKEHNFKLGRPKSPETGITMIICKLSATIAYLESKGIKRSLTGVVDGVMDSCLMAGKLDDVGLSLNEYKIIKDYLLEEAKVSYDYFSGK